MVVLESLSHSHILSYVTLRNFNQASTSMAATLVLFYSARELHSVHLLFHWLTSLPALTCVLHSTGT